MNITRQLLLTILLMSVGVTAWAENRQAESAMDECYLSDIDYSEHAGLTRAERIEAMNRAFFDSVNRFEECVLSTDSTSSSASSSSSSAAGSNGTGSNADSMSGTEGTADAVDTLQDSVAASELGGTEAEPMDAAKVAEILENNKPADMADAEQSVSKTDVMNKNGPSGQGAPPQDIPDANNDDVVAAQIRLAAEIETDPEKKAKLWNEYRKYKGLPEKEE